MVPLGRTRLILKQPFQMLQADIIFMGISIRLQTVEISISSIPDGYLMRHIAHCNECAPIAYVDEPIFLKYHILSFGCLAKWSY